jgi:imidazolonepropionase-like amidohydrolase
MKRALGSFIAAAFLVLICSGCSVRKDQVTAFINVNLIPMTDETTVTDQTVLVKGKTIIAIGPSNLVAIPENANVIEGAGAYLMPGLTDMHMHTRDDWLSNDWPVSPLKLYLANGVTTIRDFGPKGRSPDYALHWRDEIKKGKRSGPTIYAAGPILYGPIEDPQRIVREQKAQGFDFIKLYSFLSKEEFYEAVTTAKQLDMYTAGHIPFSVGLNSVLTAGMHEIAHIEELDFELLDFDRNKKMRPKQWFFYLTEAAVKQYEASFGLDIEDLKKRHGEAISVVISKLQSTDISICTTLVVGEIIVRKLFEPEAFLVRPENRYLPKWYMEAFYQGKEKHQVQFRGNEGLAPFKYTMEKILLSELRKAGIRLLLATDAGTGGMGIVPGFSIHDELRILTENGFTPYEAIATGTVNASRVVKAMTGVDDIGTIEVGKRADLILVNENPLKDVANIKDLRGVMAAGRWYSKETLEEMISIED